MLWTTFFLSAVSFAYSAVATGVFLNPSGNDGSLSVTTGSTIDISWTNTSDYNILSLGYFSTSNQTITWLISNSQSNPTSYRWTVDAVAQGFNLADSRLFAFYICEGVDFGDPFLSSYFVINDASSSSSSSTTTTSVATSTSNLPSVITPTNSSTGTGTTVVSSATAAPATSSSSSTSGLSTGAKAGIAVGIVVGLLGAAAIAFLFVRHRRKSRQAQTNVSKFASSEMSSANSPGGGAYGEADMKKGSGDSQDKPNPYSGAQEMPANNDRPVELGSGDRTESGRVELPGTRQ